MKNLLNKIFKNEPQFNYIIAEYQPMKTGKFETRSKLSEYDIDEPSTSDEMEIDRLYQRS
jgi:hypothetical protein